LGIFKSRRLSHEDLLLSFGAIAFPLHVWAMINILAILPAWLLRLSTWELAGAISYPLVDALLESCILWIGLVGLSIILPKKWFANQFVGLSSALLWLLVAWAVVFQFFFDRILLLDTELVLIGLLLMAFSFVLVNWIVHRPGRVEGWIKEIAQGLVVLAYIYLLFDLVGLIIIVIRNL
jgi:hypothetical protein